MEALSKTLIIACGALAKEIVALRTANNWEFVDIQCLPANLHNSPNKIKDAVSDVINANADRYKKIFVAYGDCGTGGELDKLLVEKNIERIPGAHCYEFFATSSLFQTLSDAEPGTFYLTDFLLRHFDRLVISGLGIDKHPELLKMFFGNYRKLLYLAQIEVPGRIEEAKLAADRLGLEFEYRFTGYGELEQSLRNFQIGAITWQN